MTSQAETLSERFEHNGAAFLLEPVTTVDGKALPHRGWFLNTIEYCDGIEELTGHGWFETKELAIAAVMP